MRGSPTFPSRLMFYLNMNKYSLGRIREIWINAYLNGEVDWLAYLEAPCFFVKENSGLTFKANQIANVSRSRARFKNKMEVDFEFKEAVEQLHEYREWATVLGSACFKRGGKIVNECRFFELWILVNDRWQIASLCLEEADLSREVE